MINACPRLALLGPADAPAYRDLLLHAYASEPDAFTSTAEERAAQPLSWWSERLAGPEGGSVAMGAFAGMQLVGSVTLSLSHRTKTRHKAELAAMFVWQGWRGAGLGRRLVEAALDYLRQHQPGVTAVALTVTEGNAPALALYEGAGFRAFGTEPMGIRTPAGYLGKVHMWRRMP